MAATESTAQTVASILYHLADNPPILRELRAQMDRMMEECHGEPTWNDLEQLRYLVSSKQSKAGVVYSWDRLIVLN